MVHDDDLFEDELADEEAEEEYEYEDVEVDDDEDEGFEEFENDFDASAGREVKVKVVPGMEGFALAWTFVATLTAACLASYVILYEVYDWRAFDLLPRKEQPAYPPPFEVIGIGRDLSVSDTTNYIMVKAGTRNSITPGTVLYVFPQGSSSTQSSDAVLTAIVSEECAGRVAKAWIVDVKAPGQAEQSDGNEGSADDAVLVAATDFSQIPETDKATALRNIWLTRGAPGQETIALEARAASWGEQRITRTVREQFGSR